MKRAALRIAGLVAVTLGLWLTLRGVSFTQMVAALRGCDLGLVLGLGLPLLAVGLVLRTARYRALLPGRGGAAPFADLAASVILSTAGNNVLPLRAGELLRTRETVAAGFPVARVAVAQVAEKVVEAATLVVCAAPALGSRLAPHGSAGAFFAVVPLGVLAMVWGARRFGVPLPQLGSALGWSFVADAVEIALVAVCLRGLALPYGLVPSVTVYACVNLAIALPSTPGNLGAFEAGAALPLIALGTPPESAVAFAFVYRAVQWLPITVAGGAVWAWRALFPHPVRARAS